MRRQLRSAVRLVAVGLMAPALAVTAVPVLPAQAAPEDAVVVELPTEVRGEPRATRLVGRTDSGQVVVTEESDPAPDSDWYGVPVQGLMAPDGTVTSFTTPAGPYYGPVSDVLGDRLVVGRTQGELPRTITHRLVGATSWSVLEVPSGQVRVDLTRDGVVVRDEATNALGLQPWSGGPVQPIAGLPAGVEVRADDRRVTDGPLAILPAGPPGAVDRRVLVDTAARTVRTLPPGSGACVTSGGTSWGIAGDRLAWEGRTDPAQPPAICSVTLGGAEVVSARRGVEREDGVEPADRRLLPVGDTVVVSRTWGDLGWGEYAGAELVAVAADGTRRDLADWAHSVVPAGPSHVLAVTGDEPGVASVVDLDVAAGTSTAVRALRPVGAWFSDVAVDDDRVVTVDDSRSGGGLRERTVDLGAGVAGASELLDTDLGRGLAAGGGGTAWSKGGGGGLHLSAAGVLSDGLEQVTETDDRWVASAATVYDTVEDELREPYVSGNWPVALQDGVAYAAGRTVPGTPLASVVATDLRTDRAQEISTGCEVSSVQVAGSWMLVTCTTAYYQPDKILVDLTGTRPPSTRFEGQVRLGNGFVVRQMNDRIEWKPLTAGWLTESWRPLFFPAFSLNNDLEFSLSRGQRATVAWVAGRRAYAARMPGVVASPLPARPTAVPPPSAPQVTAAGVDRGAVVRWSAPPASEQVRLMQLSVSDQGNLVKAEELTPGVQVARVDGLFNGRTYDVTLTSWNAAGAVASRTLQVIPATRPRLDTVSVFVDEATSRAHVRWSLETTPTTEPVQSFSVSAGPVELKNLPATARSASFVVPVATTAPVVVTAHGVEQQDVRQSEVLTFPGTPAPDTVAPTASFSGLRSITLTPGARFVVSGTDDRTLRHDAVEVRTRTAYSGRKLGPWSTVLTRYPLGVQELPVYRNSTTCFSARTRDAGGNVSAWTEPSCTTTPFDDAELKRSGPAKKLSGGQYAYESATVLTRRTSTLSPRMWVPSNGYLVATTCSTCGSVKVSVAGKSQGVLSLRSSTTRHQQLLRLPGPKNRFGKLVLQPTSKKSVTIDGVVLLGN